MYWSILELFDIDILKRSRVWIWFSRDLERERGDAAEVGVVVGDERGLAGARVL
jgi:hypothetical protein